MWLTRWCVCWVDAESYFDNLGWFKKAVLYVCFLLYVIVLLDITVI